MLLTLLQCMRQSPYSKQLLAKTSMVPRWRTLLWGILTLPHPPGPFLPSFLYHCLCIQQLLITNTWISDSYLWGRQMRPGTASCRIPCTEEQTPQLTFTLNTMIGEISKSYTQPKLGTSGRTSWRKWPLCWDFKTELELIRGRVDRG